MKKAEQPQLGVKYDNTKTRYDLLDPEFCEGVANVLTFGSSKYSDNNWKKVTPFQDRYYAACIRHIQAWRMGEKIDYESGQHHLFHAACCLYFLLWKDNYNDKPIF